MKFLDSGFRRNDKRNMTSSLRWVVVDKISYNRDSILEEEFEEKIREG